MGERTDDLEKPERLEHDVRGLRSRLDDLINELDHRRHDFMDWRLQLRRHVREVGIFVGGLTAIVVAAIWRGIAHRRQRRRLASPWYRSGWLLER